MNDTNNANTSSAVAVADGASAAASTKIVGAPPTAATPSTKSSSHINLLIKASNQQFEDQIIESDLLWTVKRLKSHLAVVYPSKPPAADQKLIYSGQLLNDNLLLKDVIRSYKDVYTHNHIIHLVYTPKNLPPIAPTAAKSKSKPASSSSVTTSSNMSSSEDGLRQRHTATQAVHMISGNRQQQNLQVSPEQMAFYSQYMPQNVFANSGVAPYPPMTPIPGYGQYNMHALAMQQAAMYSWMQQVYSQYMEQCLRVSNNVNGMNDDASRSGVAGSTLPPFSTFPQNPFLQQFPQTVISTTAQPASVAATDAAMTEQQQPPQNAEQAAQQQPAQAQVVPPRFPNMPQDEPDNRDWLDNIFSLTRLALFMTILYFNSSPLRCLAVVIIAGGIYLYHIGVFRLRHERNNNNLNRNNNAVQNAAVDQIRQGVDQQQEQPQQQQQANENENADQGNNRIANVGDNNTPTPVVGENTEQQQPTATNSDAVDSPDNAANDNNESMISTLRTFVVTFFTSLLPEAPAL